MAVAVAVAVAVIAPVTVAALVNGNDTVIVIAPVDDQGSARQQRHDGFDQLDPSHVVLGVEQRVDSHDVEV